MLKTTETLLQGLAANDQSRWARFYRDYAPWIEKTLCAKGLPPDDAEDVIHETLVELARIMPSYKYDPERKGAFHSLIFKIAQNKAYDLHRRREREQKRIERATEDPTTAGQTVTIPDFAFAVSESDWQLETMNMALRRVFADPAIRDSSKIAFRRVVQMNESPATVANELGIEVNAIYQIKSRMIERLRNEIRKIQESSPDGI